MRGWYGWLLDRWELARESYWFYPGQMALLSAVLAMSAIEFDRRLSPEMISSIPWLTEISADSARSVLSTIAGSMMTVTGVVFSITIVALTLTSSQFGPRLLRTFFRDRSTQIALGIFLATFFYSLLVLRATGTPERVPYIATAGSVVLAGISLFVFIFFVHHAANSLQASTVIAAVAREIDEQLPSLFPDDIGQGDEISIEGEDRARLERLDREGVTVRAEAEGYVRLLQAESLLGLATAKDLLIRVDARPGRFVTFGSALFRVLTLDGGAWDESVDTEIRACCVIGDHRTPAQDLFFLTDQLSEMAVRALSPGINDPRTAIACIHRLGAVLVRIANLDMPRGFRFDAENDLRVVIVDATRFETLVGSCFDSIRRHGVKDPEIAVALLEAIRAAAEECRIASRLRILGVHAGEIREQYRHANEEGSRRDLELVEGVFQRLRRVLEQ